MFSGGSGVRRLTTTKVTAEIRKAKKLKERYQSNPHVKWVKIVFAPDQEEVQKMIITVMDPAGMLTTSESQIPG